MKKILGMLLILAAVVAACVGRTTAPVASTSEMAEARLVRQSYSSSSDGECEYLVYLPRGYDSDPARRWPLMLFLHGDGERGNAREDLAWVLVHGPVYEAWIQKRDLPFVIVSPQLPLFGRDKTVDYIANRKPEDIPQRLETGVPPRPEDFSTPWEMVGGAASAELPMGPEGPPDGWPRREEDLLTILDQALATYRTDPDRVYLTGISYGGFGTWYMASKHPERFAALAPVVGWGHPDLMPPLAERPVPVWAFAGGRDPVVWPQFFYPGLNALEKLGNEEVRFTIHVDTGHDTWRRVYEGQDLYEWMLLYHAPSE